MTSDMADLWLAAIFSHLQFAAAVDWGPLFWHSSTFEPTLWGEKKCFAPFHTLTHIISIRFHMCDEVIQAYFIS